MSGCGCSAGGKPLLYACAGASSLGQLSHAVAVRLTREGKARMSCLAGVGAHKSGFVVSARDSERVVVIDGCDKRCALATFRHLDIEPHVHIDLGEIGLRKHFDVVTDDEARCAYDQVLTRLAS